MRLGRNSSYLLLVLRKIRFVLAKEMMRWNEVDRRCIRKQQRVSRNTISNALRNNVAVHRVVLCPLGWHGTKCKYKRNLK